MRAEALRGALDASSGRRDAAAAAELLDICGIGLELRYTRTGKPFVRRIFADGADLLREAAIERFELEALGWRSPQRGGVSFYCRKGVNFSCRLTGSADRMPLPYPVSLG
jgi:hypothetical protein